MPERLSTVFPVKRRENAHGWVGEWNFPPELFEHIDQQEALAVVARLLKPSKIKQSDYVFKTGDPSKNMYFLNKGSLAVLVDGRKVDVLQVGDFVGEIGMALDEKRRADVQANADSEILELAWKDLCTIGFECPVFVCNVCKSISRSNGPNSARARNATRRMLLICSGDAHPSFVGTNDDKVVKETAKDRKERVEKYTESVKEEEETKLIIGMKKSFPFGSSLRDAMQTLELAREFTADCLKAVTKNKDISNEDVTRLRQLAWLRNVPTVAIAEIIARSSCRSYGPGGTILNGKESPRNIYFVCRGSVRVHQASAGRVQTQMVNQGACFGLAGVVAENRRLHVMEAYPTGDGCKLLELPAVEMRQILDLYPVLWDSVERIRDLRRILPRPGRPNMCAVSAS